MEAAFDRGAAVDYGVMVKNDSEAPADEHRRYSPSKSVSATLTPMRKTLRCTPEMAAGIVSVAWKVRDLVKHAEEREIMRV